MDNLPQTAFRVVLQQDLQRTLENLAFPTNALSGGLATFDSGQRGRPWALQCSSQVACSSWRSKDAFRYRHCASLDLLPWPD